MNIKIYVATQKEIPFKLDDCYEPMYVGADFLDKSNDYGYIPDNVGDNISSKNKSYCELTALYWMWKNSKSDIVGLCHYRRYLSESILTTNPNKIIGSNRISEILNEYDIILPKESLIWGPVEKHYSTGQHAKDYTLCGMILKEKFPDYYEDFRIVSKSDKIFICNMFICPKSLIDSYCEWLFEILFELEKRVDLKDYTIAEQRIYGYLSERLFNVWLLHNKPKIFRCTLLNTEAKFINWVKWAFHTFNYKVLKIDVLKHVAKRNEKRRMKKQK